MKSCCADVCTEEEFVDIFDEDFTSEDKAYISAVITRLRRILNWDPVDESQVLDKKYGSQIVQEILSQFQRWKEYVHLSDAPDTKRIQHLIIFSLAKLSLYYWIADSRLVADILTEVYICDRHFSSMFAHIVQRHDRHSLLRQMSDYSIQREDSTTIFFLHHAHKARLEFDGIRFLDVRLRFPLNIPPVFLAAIYNKPNILLRLLRFGAKVNIMPNRLPDDWNLSMLFRHLIRILWNSLGENLHYLEHSSSSDGSTVMSKTIYQATECVRILLRVVPQESRAIFNAMG